MDGQRSQAFFALASDSLGTQLGGRRLTMGLGRARLDLAGGFGNFAQADVTVVVVHVVANISIFNESACAPLRFYGGAVR